MLATRAEKAIAGDPVLESLWPRVSTSTSINSQPEGADVSVSVIGGDGTWLPLGRTPLKDIRVPRGVFHWRIEKAGFEKLDVVPATEYQHRFYQVWRMSWF